MTKDEKIYVLYNGNRTMVGVLLGSAIAKWDGLSTPHTQVITPLGVVLLITSYFLFKKHMHGKKIDPGKPFGDKFRRLISDKPIVGWLISTFVSISIFASIFYLFSKTSTG